MVSRIPLDSICEKKIETLSSQYEGEIEYIDISSIDNISKIISNTQVVDSKEAPSRARQLVKYGDILVSTVRPNLNAVAVIEKESKHILVASTGYCVLRCNSETDNHFVFHFCQSPYFIEDMVRQATGASYPAVSNSIVKNCLIPLRNLKEQRHIATVLDKVSDLISLRKQQLAKLDELVKARFVEMFGDENNLSTWPCCTVGDVADVCVGVVIKPTQYYTDDGIPAFRSLNIGEMYVKDSDWVYFTQEGHQKNQKSAIRKNDVLVVRSGAPGTACVANDKYAGYNAVDIIIAHPDSAKINSTFLAMFTNLPHGMNQIKGKTGGAAQQHFNVSGYKSLKLMLPPLDYQNEFASFVVQTDRLRLTIQQSLDKLEVLKKALMQEYFG